MPSLAKVVVGGAALSSVAQAYMMPAGAAPIASSQVEAQSLAEQVLAQEWATSAAVEAEAASSWKSLAVGAALGLFAAVVGGRPALAADIENGQQVFGANCAACHAGGNNTVVPEKKLKKEALQQYGKYEVSAIITQVTNGNGAMPAFGERLAPDDIEDVANYVRAQADKGW